MPGGAWSERIRLAIIVAGLAWPLGVLAYWFVADAKHGRDFAFAMIGVIFMMMMFGVPTLVVSLLLPSHRLRLIVIPMVVIGFKLYLAIGKSSNVNYPGLFGMVPWIFTFLAVSLIIPEFPSMGRFYRQLIGKPRAEDGTSEER